MSNHPWRQYRPTTRARTDRIQLDEDTDDVPRYRSWTIRQVDSQVSDRIKRRAKETGQTIGAVLAEAMDAIDKYGT